MNKVSVLVVDDEEILLKSFQKGLGAKGYCVTIAISGKEAIGLAKKEKFDIVLTDLVMPEMDGVQVCREIKKISPETEVLLISGYPVELNKHQADFVRAGGRQEIIRKRISTSFSSSIAEVAETIEKVMSETKVRLT